MANTTISSELQSNHEREIWDDLKRAIAASSGFKQWQERQDPQSNQAPSVNLDEVNADSGNAFQSTVDQEVRRYLRDTLETLAY